MKKFVFGVTASLLFASPAWSDEGKAPPYFPEVSDDGTAKVQTFEVPFSAYASKEARELFVERANKPLPYFRFTPETPISEIRRIMDEEWFAPQIAAAKKLYAVSMKVKMIGGVRTQVFTPDEGIAPENTHRVLINLHGGGFNIGSMTASQVESIPLAAVGRIKVISVDYRMAPEFHFPAGSEDAAAVYRELLNTYRPGEIAIYGCSAGGMLTAQAVAWFQKHDLPAPASIGIFCASAQRERVGDSAYVTPRLGGIIPPPTAEGGLGYFEGADLNDPLVSPSYVPEVLEKFPPTLFVTGTRAGEMSSVTRDVIEMTKAGVDVKMLLWDSMDHGFFMDAQLPESQEAFELMYRFFNQHFSDPR